MTFFETSEPDDVLGSLEHFEWCLERTLTNPHEWKWVVLSLFGAVQGSIVCHAAGSTQTEVLTDESAKQMLLWLDAAPSVRGAYPTEKLAGPDTLYKRLNGTYPRMSPAGGVIRTTSAQDKAFSSLKGLRDDFNHFSPRGWLIEKELMLECIAPMLDLIETILRCGYAFRHGQTDAIHDAIQRSRKALDNLT